MIGEDSVVPTTEEITKLFTTLQTAVEATASSAHPLLTKACNADPSLDLSSGLSLLLVRPHLLLSSLHHLLILLAMRLASPSSHEINASSTGSFGDPRRTRKALGDVEAAGDELAGELRTNHEVMEKVKGLEGKLEYQIKKLVGLAEAERGKGTEVVEGIEEDPLSFRPNPSAIISERSLARSGRTKNRDDGSDLEAESSRTGVYRPPRVSAVPYNERSSSKGRRTDRRAPALLSEFATTMDGAPLLESTSGLSTRPVQADRHTNSTSAKRAAELERIDRFEEENMTRLVTTKREAKRRKEDEAALSLGYGVGGPARSRGRKQNGLEAELEGVLGERGSRGLWEGVGSKLGKREGVLEGGRKRGSEVVPRKNQKARFEKDVRGFGKKSRA